MVFSLTRLLFWLWLLSNLAGLLWPQRLLQACHLRRWFEGCVEPAPELAMHEQLLTEQGQQIGQAPAEGGSQLQVAQNQHGNQRGPDLNANRILIGADEGLNLQQLFEATKEGLSGKGLARC
jgi:hypothetical protein